MNIKFYWININKSLNRRYFMEEQFKINGLSNERIEAITPETLEAIIEDKPPFNCGSPGCIYNNQNDCKFEFSCTCSHLNAIKAGYNSNEPFFIVCEDDIYFPFKLDYDKIIKTLPTDFDICQMMVINDEANDYIYNECLKGKGELFIKYDCTKKFFGAGMYLLSRNGAKRILDLFINENSLKYDFRDVPSLKQADFMLYMYVNSYTITFPLCFPVLLFVSEIHPKHYYFHKQAIDKIIANINDNQLKHPFIINYYPFDSFYNHYKALIDNKNYQKDNN